MRILDRYRTTHPVPRMRHAPILILTALLVVACAQPGSAPPPGTPMPSALPVDARLQAALIDLAAHPAWTAGIPFGRFTVTDAVAGPTFLCVELSRPEMPAAVAAVDVRTVPWRVVQTAIPDPSTPDDLVIPYTGDLGPDDEANAAEVCLATAGGHQGSWPADAEAIDVSGYLADTPLAEALREALLADPAAFGIDSIGTPALSLWPRYPDAMDPIDGPPEPGCIGATVYVGGPRAAVHARYREVDGRVWIDRVRVVDRALWPVDETPPDGC